MNLEQQIKKAKEDMNAAADEYANAILIREDPEFILFLLRRTEDTEEAYSNLTESTLAH